MAKPFMVERALEIAIIVAVVGALLTALSLVQLTVADLGMGDWAYWTVVAGLICFVVGLYLLIGYLRRAAEFEKYMGTESRADFKRGLDDMEYLAWRLPSRFERRLLDKKEELGLK